MLKHYKINTKSDITYILYFCKIVLTFPKKSSTELLSLKILVLT